MESSAADQQAVETQPAKKGRPRKNPDYVPPVRPEDRVVDVSDIPEDRPADTGLNAVIERANELLEQRKTLQQQFAETRLLANMMINNNVGDREQVEWVRKFLPRKTKGNGAEE